MKNYHPLLSFIVGIWLIIVGLQMAQALQIEKVPVPGNKGKYAAIGAGVGAGAGFVTWLIVGGIGIATGGWAIGLGAIGLTTIGASAGALGGAAAGSSSVIIDQPQPLYSIWAWGTVLAVGAVITYRSGRLLNAQIAAWWASCNTSDQQPNA